MITKLQITYHTILKNYATQNNQVNQINPIDERFTSAFRSTLRI